MVPFVKKYVCKVDFLYLRSGNSVVAFWEIAAHSAYDMFSKYKYLIVHLIFPTTVFGVGISF